MAFDWNGYLGVASNLKTETDGQPDSVVVEAKRRTAISRAYYAVYHSALVYATTVLGYTPPSHVVSLHNALQKKYKQQSGNTDHREVGQILTRLHQYRVNCDYDSRDLGNLQKLLSSVVSEVDRVNTILTH